MGFTQAIATKGSSTVRTLTALPMIGTHHTCTHRLIIRLALCYSCLMHLYTRRPCYFVVSCESSWVGGIAVGTLRCVAKAVFFRVSFSLHLAGPCILNA